MKFTRIMTASVLIIGAVNSLMLTSSAFAQHQKDKPPGVIGGIGNAPGNCTIPGQCNGQGGFPGQGQGGFPGQGQGGHQGWGCKTTQDFVSRPVQQSFMGMKQTLPVRALLNLNQKQYDGVTVQHVVLRAQAIMMPGPKGKGGGAIRAQLIMNDQPIGQAIRLAPGMQDNVLRLPLNATLDGMIRTLQIELTGNVYVESVGAQILKEICHQPPPPPVPPQFLNPMNGMRWSYAGAIPGMNCVRIVEVADPKDWHDNFLCTPRDFGFKWSSGGPIPGMQCVQFLEPSDPHTWNDNFLCSPRDYRLQWSYRGPIPGRQCVQIVEPSDPHTWNDNFLCGDY